MRSTAHVPLDDDLDFAPPAPEPPGAEAAEALYAIKPTREATESAHTELDDAINTPWPASPTRPPMPPPPAAALMPLPPGPEAPNYETLTPSTIEVLESCGDTVAVWPIESDHYEPESTLVELIEPTTKLVVLGPGPDVNTLLLIAEAVDADYPGVAVILFAEPTTSVLERALRYGIRGVMATNAPQEELCAVIDKAISSAGRRQDHAAPLSDADAGRVIVVASPKGGAGKTTISSNLAAALAADYPSQVVLVDLDLQFGDISAVFGIEPQATMTDLARSGRTLTSTQIKTVLTRDPDGQLYILAAPSQPAEADELMAERVAETIRLLSREFRFVVVDTPAGIDEFTLEVLDLATDIMFVTSMDIPAVRAATKEIELLNVLGLTSATRHLILNRANSKVGLSVDEIEGLMGTPIDIHIPSTRRIPLSINNGRPLVTTEPKSPAARAILELAARVLPVAEPVVSGWRNRRKGS